MKSNQNQGFTSVELVIVLVVLGVLAATALPRFIELRREARIAAVQALAGAVSQANTIAHSKALVTNNLGQPVGTVFVDMGGVPVRIWNGWPDRWWDGIGIALEGATPTSGGYLSTAPYAYEQFTFYGFGNTQLPGGLAGWLMPGAPTPRACSVTFATNGSGALPSITTNTGGC